MRMIPSTKVIVSLVAALSVGIFCQREVSAKNVFVSPAGNGSDGSSWANAVQDPAKIDWTKVSAGDHIVLDGGTSSITYVTSVTVPVSNIVIRQSQEAGHSGQVILRGAISRSLASGIGMTITGSNVHVLAGRRSGILFSRYAAQALSVNGNNNVFRNLEFNEITGYQPYGSGKVGGVTFGGSNNQFIACDFRDTTNGAVSTPVSDARNLAVFRNCTFGSSRYGYWGESGTAIQGSKSGSAATVYVDSCVFGPFVNYGVDTGNDNMILSNSLFLAGGKANLRCAPTAGRPSVMVSRCTLYDKKFLSGPGVMNVPYYGSPSALVSNGLGALRIRDSIVYGGIVDVPPAQLVSGGGNVQFAVSGNTLALAPTLVDPQFVDSATLSAPIAAADFVPKTLTSLDFARSSGSPAANKGSSLTKVSNIVAPFGPAYGLPIAIGGP